MAVFLVLGIGLRLAWKTARWWLPPAAVGSQVGGRAHPAAIVVAVALFSLWWPPTRWA